MYNKSNWYKSLRKQLRDADEQRELEGKYTLIFQVELGLRLLETLAIYDEPIEVLWVILSGTPIRDPLFDNLTIEQRQAIARARVLLPFSGRFNWMYALKDYAAIPAHWRVFPHSGENVERQLLERHLNYRNRERLTVYDNVLAHRLEYAEWSKHEDAPADGRYMFEAHMSTGRQVIPVEIPLEMIARASVMFDWFQGPVERKRMEFSHAVLQEVAQILDELEKVRGVTATEWRRLADEVIRYRAIGGTGLRNCLESRMMGSKLEG